MQSPRITSIRHQTSPDKTKLEYPYSFINSKQYPEYQNLSPKKIIGEPTEEKIDFPSCVSHYYWIHEGRNDEVPWRALFTYVDENGKKRYGFYLGECDYTGFDCRGSMYLYVSDRIDVLIEKAFTNEDYRLYLLETLET